MMANRVESFSQTNNVSSEGNGCDDLYMELWKLCAGPLVELEASTNQTLNQRIPLFNLPSKILCRVVHIQLLAEKETDEVYAQVTLLPEPSQPEPTTPDLCPPESQRPTVHSFCKVLTASDTSTHGGFSVLRKHATDCLPKLDMNDATPTQELVAKDLHGYEWRFKHIFRGNMNTTSQFIIGLNKYLEALSNKFAVGMRFKMKFEGEDSPERRFSGTIVGVEDFSPLWKDSKWRSLKVQWDEPASIPRPDRVSPWEIEPFAAPIPPSLTQPVAAKNKRPRPPAEIPAPDLSSTTSAPYSGVTHCHDLTPQNIAAEAKGNENPVIGHHMWTEMSSGCSSVAKALNKGSWLSSPGTCVPHHLFPDAREDKTRFSAWPVPSGFSNPQLNEDSTFDSTEKAKRSETAASCRLFGIDLINHSTSSTPLERTPAQLSTMIMGTEVPGPSTLSSTYSDQKSEISKDSKEKKLEQLQLSAKENQSMQSCSSFTRSRTKVQMQGIAVGRAVDLAMFEGYGQLIDELEEMFDIKGELRPR
ncbi:hypothetical protein Gorai_017812, partial [Gossypium raimondii]|nr:hypothetical protein [Gossypium raimondii]